MERGARGVGSGGTGALTVPGYDWPERAFGFHDFEVDSRDSDRGWPLAEVAPTAAASPRGLASRAGCPGVRLQMLFWGGNCIELSPSPDGDVTNLHAFWDVTAVNALGYSAPTIAAELDGKITPADVKAWSAGEPRDWAMQSLAAAKRDAYNLPTRPTCAQPGAVALSAAYQKTAEADAAHQLSVTGIRLAYVLNGALGRDGR